MLKTNFTVLICAHDAGGANLLFAWAKRANCQLNLIQNVQGPAEKIFGQTFPSEFLWENVDFVLTGTGWQTDFEWQCLQEANRRGIKSAAYLDHWVNYGSRFQRDGRTVLPNELWCADALALKIAREMDLFQSISIKYVPNQYWGNVKQRLSVQDRDSILIVHEPVRDPSVDIRQLIESLLAFLEREKNHIGVIVRPHPSGMDSFGHQLTEQLSARFEFSISQEALEEDLSKAVCVVGFLSMVLPMAASLGYPVKSLAPAPLPYYLEYFGVEAL